MKPLLRIQTVGQASATVGAHDVTPVADVLFSALLVFGLDRGRGRTRTELSTLLWPEASTTRQGERLRWLLSKLRGYGLDVDLGNGTIGLVRKQVALDTDSLASLSLGATGPILPGFGSQEDTPFEAWLAAQRERLTADVTRHLVARIAEAKGRGNWRGVEDIATAMLRVSPGSEDGVFGLAEAQCRNGNTELSLKTVAQYSAALRVEDDDAILRAKVLEQRLRSAHRAGRMVESQTVGRDAELQLIDDLLVSARGGQGSAIVFDGPAGIGKTRLLDEARIRASLAGMQVVRAQCVRSDATRPLSGFTDLIPLLLDLPGALGCDPDRLDRLRRLTNVDQTAAPSGEMRTQDSSWTHALLLDAMLDLVAATSEEAALCIQVDDIQWTDPSLTWFWDSVVARTSEHRVAWIFASRSTRREPVKLNVPRQSVRSLDDAAAIALVDQLLAQSENQAETRPSAFIERGGGNPLFLRELVRHAASESTETAPRRLAALLELGLSNLSSVAQRTLQVAAVLGKYATLERLETVAGLPRLELVDSIAELEGAAIIAADASGAFVYHALWSEAASAQTTPTVGRLLHRHAAEQFDRELSNVTDANLVWECARHWEMAGDLDRARRGIAINAVALAENGFPMDAAVAMERAIRWTADPRERLPLLERRVEIFSEAGNLEAVTSEASRYEEHARQLNPLFDGHSRVELLTTRAQTWTLRAIPRATSLYAACARSNSADNAHRFHAARLCAIGAEMTCTATLAEMHDIVSRLRVDSDEDRYSKFVVQFLFNMRSGQVLLAADMAEAELLRTSIKDVRRHQLVLGHVSMAALIGGLFDRARHTAVMRFDEAKRLAAPDHIISAFDRLLAIEMERGGLDEARHVLEAGWPATLEHAGILEPERFRTLRSLYQSTLHVLRGDARRALVPQAMMTDRRGLPLRNEARVIAIELARRFAQREPLRALRDRLAECLQFPDHWLDWPAQIYCEILVHDGLLAEARDFAERYATRLRIELYEPPTIISQLISGEEVRPRRLLGLFESCVVLPKVGGVRGSRAMASV